MSQPPETTKPARKPVTALTLALWAAPVLAGFGVLALALAMNWQPLEFANSAICLKVENGSLNPVS